MRCRSRSRDDGEVVQGGAKWNGDSLFCPRTRTRNLRTWNLRRPVQSSTAEKLRHAPAAGAPKLTNQARESSGWVLTHFAACGCRGAKSMADLTGNWQLQIHPPSSTSFVRADSYLSHQPRQYLPADPDRSLTRAAASTFRNKSHKNGGASADQAGSCLLYTSPSPRD